MTKKKVTILAIASTTLVVHRLVIFDPTVWQYAPIARGCSVGWLLGSYEFTIRGSTRTQVLDLLGKPDEGRSLNQIWIYKMPTITMGQGALAVVFDNSNNSARVSTLRLFDSY